MNLPLGTIPAEPYMQNFIRDIFATGFYLLAITIGITSFMKNQKRFRIIKGAEIELALFLITFIVLVMDWIGFYRGFQPNANQVLLGFWLLINIGCFFMLFHSSCTNNVFQWITYISIFNLNNVFWHLNYADTSALIAETGTFRNAYVFLLMGFIGIACLFIHCVVFNCGRIKNATAPDFVKQICMLAIVSGVLLYFTFSAFYPFTLLEEEAISPEKVVQVYIVFLGSIAVLGILGTAFLYFAHISYSEEDQPEKSVMKKKLSAFFVIVILLTALTKVIACDFRDFFIKQTTPTTSPTRVNQENLPQPSFESEPKDIEPPTTF